MRLLRAEDFGEPAHPVPEVPAGRGPRQMILVGWALAVVALVVVGSTLLFSSAGLFAGTPVASRDDATITVRDETAFGRGCDKVRYELALDGDTVSFDACRDDPSAGYQPGDVVAVYSVPWTTGVTPVEAAGGERVGAVVGLVGGGALAVVMFRIVRSYRRLRSEGPPVPYLTSRLVKVTPRAITVVPYPPDDTWPPVVVEDEEEIVLLPAGTPRGLQVGMNLDLWPSRRSFLRGRPCGPWVVLSRDGAVAFTHAWARSKRQDRPQHP